MREILLKAIGIMLILLMPAASVSAQAESDEFLPLSKTHLRGRRIDARDFEPATGTSVSDKPGVDLKSMVVSELQRVKSETGSGVKSGVTNSFKDTISSVRIEGRFEILAAYTAVNDNYLRTIERTIRSNIFPPIIARTIQQSATVAVTFLVRKDGTITQIEKESSTGSPALDATAISACRSSSPLPPLPSSAVDDVVRMRFTLTFNPQPQ